MVDKVQRLRKMKLIAASMLAVMVFIYLITKPLEKTYPWLEYVRVFAEASMIGGLADWFAVSALFRHPLGLPIPHTNLIERKKVGLANSMGDFVTLNFLSDDSVKEQLNKVNLSKEVLTLISKEESIKMISKEIIKLAPKIIKGIDEEKINEVIQTNLKNFIENIDPSETFSKIISYLIESNLHQKLLNDIAKILIESIQDKKFKDSVYEEVKKNSKWFVPDAIEKLLAKTIIQTLENELKDLRSNDDHNIRLKLNEFMKNYVVLLQTSPKHKEDAEGLKQSLLNSDAFLKNTENLWADIKGGIMKDIESEDSKLAKYIYDTLLYISIKLQENKELQYGFDKTMKRQILHFVRRVREDIGKFIANKIVSWENVSEKIEVELGKDLQFIRINGTLVGGLIGLLLYILFEKIIPMF